MDDSSSHRRLLLSGPVSVDSSSIRVSSVASEAGQGELLSIQAVTDDLGALVRPSNPRFPMPTTFSMCSSMPEHFCRNCSQVPVGNVLVRRGRIWRTWHSARIACALGMLLLKDDDEEGTGAMQALPLAGSSTFRAGEDQKIDGNVMYIAKIQAGNRYLAIALEDKDRRDAWLDAIRFESTRTLAFFQ